MISSDNSIQTNDGGNMNDDGEGIRKTPPLLPPPSNESTKLMHLPPSFHLLPIRTPPRLLHLGNMTRSPLPQHIQLWLEVPPPLITRPISLFSFALNLFVVVLLNKKSANAPATINTGQETPTPTPTVTALLLLWFCCGGEVALDVEVGDTVGGVVEIVAEFVLEEEVVDAELDDVVLEEIVEELELPFVILK